MIKYLLHNEIDTKKWDQCITKSFNSMIYAYSWYLDAVCEQWDALIEDDYKRIMPLPTNKKAGISYLFQPNFTQQLGIISQDKMDSSIVESFLNAIPKKFRLVEINLNTNNIICESKKHTFIKNSNYELDLIRPYEELYSNYSSNLKRNLKKAIKNEIKVFPNTKPDDIIKLFRNNRGRDIKTLKEKNYQCLSKLIYLLIHRGRAQVWGSYNERNELVAGAFFIKSNKKWIFLFSGTAQSARKNGAMPFLIDSFIKTNANSNITLDFEGSNDTNLARFYAGFGAKNCSYYGIIRNRLPWIVKILSGKN